MKKALIALDKETIKSRAISAMENCMAYISLANRKKAAMYYGEAETWAAMLTWFDVYLDEDDEHYADMLVIWDSETKDW